MWRKLVLAFFAMVLPMLLCAGPAAAQPNAVPETGPGGSAATKSAKELPKGFPSDLKKFVAGTDEFKSAPWFNGECKDKGGDIGQYVGSVMSQENRLLYWTATEDTRLAMWGPSLAMTQNPALIDAVVAAGGQGSAMTGIRLDAEENKKAVLSITDEAVLASVYPDVYPAGDDRRHPPKPTCADDVAGWTTKTSSTWGFDWAKTPDSASLKVMKSQPFADMVPDDAWNDTCASSAPSSLCTHAMFVNCDKTTDRDDQAACMAWNTKIGSLFGETMNWINQNTSFSDRLEAGLESAFKATPQYKAGQMYVNGFSWVWDNVVGPTADMVAFIKDPSNVIDQWANSLKDSAISTTNAVLHGLAGIGEFDPANEGFLTWYAIAAGLGILVMSVMTLLALTKAADGQRAPGDLAKDLFGYMPAGVMMMMFAPGIAQMLISLIHELSLAIVERMGTDTDEVVGNLSSMLGSLTNETMVGGAVAAIIGFALMLIGALSMFFGFLMHSAALPVLAIVSAIAFGMWVHPVWRRKALRPVMMFLGVMMSKPLLLILLAGIFTVINISATSSVADDGELESLGQLGLVAVCFVIVGLAPFSLLKYGPILPTSADSADFGTGGSATAQTIGSGAGFFAMRAGGGSSVSNHNASAAQAPGRTGAPGGGSAGAGAPTGGLSGQSASSTHASVGLGAKNSPKHGGHGGGGAEAKLLGAASKTAGLASKTAGVAGAAATVAAPIALTTAGAAMNKAASAAQSAPEHSDGGN